MLGYPSSHLKLLNYGRISGYGTYDALSGPLRKIVDGLNAWHTSLVKLHLPIISYKRITHHLYQACQRSRGIPLESSP